jgi:hypothetical protein
VLARDPGDELAVTGHARAVERRQHDPALAQVLGPVEQEHRRAAEERAQDHVRLAGVQQRRVAGEDLADGIGVGEHHPRRLGADPDRERVAVLALGAQHERPGPQGPGGGLGRPRHARAGREGGHAETLPAPSQPAVRRLIPRWVARAAPAPEDRKCGRSTECRTPDDDAAAQAGPGASAAGGSPIPESGWPP